MRVRFRCDPALEGLLPRPVAATEKLPGWLREMPATAASELHGSEVRTVKQCPPFVDAMRHGFMMVLPCDVTVASGRFSWSWPLPRLASDLHPRAPLSFHVADQTEGTPLRLGDRPVVKFNSFWTIELEPGHSLFATHPANRADLPFCTLTGLVDSDRFHDVGILFPALWTDPDFEGVLPAGTPVAQCFPVLRDQITLEYDTLDPDEVAAYDALANDLLSAPGVYRKRYRDRSGRERPASSK